MESLMLMVLGDNGSFSSIQMYMITAIYLTYIICTTVGIVSYSYDSFCSKRFLLIVNILFNHVVVVYPLPWPLLVGGVRCSRLWSTSQLLRPSGQQCSHSGGVCPQIQGRQCGACVGAVEEMMCVVCVDVTEGA